MLYIEKSWAKELQVELKKEYIVALKQFLSEEKARGEVIFPPDEEVFDAFRKTPFDQVRVVIVGQDPYHGKGQAHGLSFSVRKGVRLPPSLKNIYKELQSDLGGEMPLSGCLEGWASQGVLLLNSTLTVRQGEPMSHHGHGWEQFTDTVILKLAERTDPLVFMLWGKSACDKCKNILNAIKHPHLVLTAPHPSPYSASSGFFGCRHFSRANEALKGWGKAPIDWFVY